MLCHRDDMKRDDMKMKCLVQQCCLLIQVFICVMGPPSVKYTIKMMGGPHSRGTKEESATLELNTHNPSGSGQKIRHLKLGKLYFFLVFVQMLNPKHTIEFWTKFM
eukprot:TRINITY_DN9134_c2_g1_i1.p1 TRINITY_DN9134_c2_g1~~TRINITY_DN9134_c2_g1_i1.p1  ORF type:complete len:106 (+),score=1.73 TRINITY_DN9134_c2_g1_i1:129-446(+)